MLKIHGLKVAVGGKTILEDINLEIKPGEAHVLFGPNGSGKSTLLGAIMGFDRYQILDGEIIFKDVDITRKPIHERSLLGIGVMFQRPPTIKGLPMQDMVRICSQGKPLNDELPERLNMSRFMQREVNLGFSGGELKRSELLQLLAQDPDMVLLDEPESGVDIENIALIGESINLLLNRGRGNNSGMCPQFKREIRPKSGLVITHTGHILNFINPDVGHVLYDGKLSCMGNPRELFGCIQKMGYGDCVRCNRPCPKMSYRRQTHGRSVNDD